MLPLVGIEPGTSDFQVQHYPFWAFACKTETLGSLYSHALLILAESKNQVVNEQKFKDLLSSTCQISPERIVLDL